MNLPTLPDISAFNLLPAREDHGFSRRISPSPQIVIFV
ncbi:Hypothetical protein ABZS17I87_01405 [Kosakonia cowanii]